MQEKAMQEPVGKLYDDTSHLTPLFFHAWHNWVVQQG
jgi:hypothetical protein